MHCPGAGRWLAKAPWPAGERKRPHRGAPIGRALAVRMAAGCKDAGGAANGRESGFVRALGGFLFGVSCAGVAWWALGA